MKRLLIPLLFLAALAAGYVVASDYNLGSMMYRATVILEKATPLQEQHCYPAGTLLEYSRPATAGLSYTAGYVLLVNGMEATTLPPGYWQDPYYTSLEKQVEQLQRELAQCQGSLGQCQSEKKQLEKQLQECQNSLSKCETQHQEQAPAPVSVSVDEGGGVQQRWLLAGAGVAALLLLLLLARR